MNILQWIVILLLGAVMLAALARRIGAPSPALLALGGVIVALLPNGPRLSLDPGLALALFVAPVLLNAAFDSSLKDLQENWFPVTCLILIAVSVTTAAVALVAHWMVPAMPWAVAVTLGAVVAPPDAAAATAVLKEVKLPHRLLVILEGESLLNDASALLIYRLAVGAAVAHADSSAIEVASTLALVVVGSVVFGVLLAYVFDNIVSRFSDVPSSIIMQFIGAFGVWILADRLELSGVLAIVTYAIVLSRRAPERMPAAVRVPSYAVWETVVFMLNALAFVLVGLQIGPILDRIGPDGRNGAIAFAVAILAITMLARAGWVLTYNRALTLINRAFGQHTPRAMFAPPLRRSMVVAWCGMRGIVTLAAALALPDGSGGTPEFPYRDLLVLTAFSVVLGTLVIQGLTLRPLVMALGLDGDEDVNDEMRIGREEMFRAALETVSDLETEVAAALRNEYSAVLEGFENTDELSRDARAAESVLRTRAREAARARLSDLRSAGVINDSTFQKLQEELDMIELDAEVRGRW